MKRGDSRRISTVVFLLVAAAGIQAAADQPKAKVDSAQVPKWSADDLDFFLHGSMSTEVVPERVLRAFIKTYPDLFPASDLASLGLLSSRLAGIRCKPNGRHGWWALRFRYGR